MKVGARIYKHPDGRWEARYRKGRREDGRILYGSAYGATWEEAEKRRAEILRKMSLLAEIGENSEAMVISESNKNIREYYAVVPKLKDAYPEPLTDEELKQFMSHLQLCRLNIRFALSLLLYLGISVGEISALRYSDINIRSGNLCIRRTMVDAKHMPGCIFNCERRTIFLPYIVKRNKEYEDLVVNGGIRYVLTDSDVSIKSLRTAKLLIKKQFDGVVNNKTVTPEVLRATFVRRAFEFGINAETVERITGLRAAVLQSKYGHFSSANISLLEGIEYENDLSDVEKQPRQMNLLILGAGSHGHAVYEIAEKTGVFQKIAFLDDNVAGDLIIGTLDDCERYRSEYPMCFIAIGNNKRRRELAERVTALGFVTPRLISTETSVARGVQIGRGSIVMPQVTINAGAVVGEFCIIASNALIGFNATVGSFAHCDCASVVMKDCVVQDSETIESGEIVRRDGIT